jgi:hypothetical protein
MEPKLAKNQTQRFYKDPDPTSERDPIGFHASKLTQELNLVDLKDLKKKVQFLGLGTG